MSSPQSPHQLPHLTLQLLKTISPSSFGALRACPLRAVWATHFVPLLPSSPKARLGSVVHRLWEAAARGKIQDELTFDQMWDSEIQVEEQKMLRDWKEAHLVPLQNSVSDFEVRRLRCRQQLARWRIGSGRASLKAELTVIDSTKTIKGRIDLIRTETDGAHLIDLKTGSIFGPDESVKSEYSQQLKLYAALYHQQAGEWPVSLTLRSADDVNHKLNWTSNECNTLLEEAQQLYSQINGLIQQGVQEGMLAQPNPQNCCYCPFRPSCSPYWHTRQTAPQKDWPIDARGDVKHLVRLGNGKLKLTLLQNGEIIHVRGLSPERQAFLDGQPVKVAFYNLRRESDGRFQEGSRTTGYTDPPYA